MNRVRHGVTQAHAIRGPASFLVLELAFTALAFGAMFRSWPVGFAVLLILIMSLVFRPTKLMVIAGYSLFWSLAAIVIGYEVAGIAGAITIGAFGSLVSFGIHMAGVTGLVESAP